MRNEQQLEDKFKEINKSLHDGRITNAARMMVELTGFERSRLMDYFTKDLQDHVAAVRAAKAYFMLEEAYRDGK